MVIVVARRARPQWPPNWPSQWMAHWRWRWWRRCLRQRRQSRSGTANHHQCHIVHCCRCPGRQRAPQVGARHALAHLCDFIDPTWSRCSRACSTIFDFQIKSYRKAHVKSHTHIKGNYVCCASELSVYMNSLHYA